MKEFAAAEWQRAGEDAALVQTIRVSTSAGRPAGDEAFVARINKSTDRPPCPKQGNRPRKP